MTYWGIPAICERMGWATVKPLYHHIRHHDFPAFLCVAPRKGARRQFFSTEIRILQWEVERVIKERERLIARAEEREWPRGFNPKGPASRGGQR